VPGYDVFAPFYDAVQGDRAEHAAYLHELIRRHHPAARTALELACGTGSILAQLRPHYEVTGLDRSPAMLERATAKVPGVRLVEADMTSFDLRERFDVVLCVFDSINHLLRFEEWQAVFALAHEHLNDRGIFVFDVNTERRLARLAEQPPAVRWFGDGDLLVLDVVGEPGGVVVWEIRVFEHRGGVDYRLHTEDIREISFPRERIRESLRDRFRRVYAHDARRSRPTAASERIHFVAVR
jgi:SAM-dependent methyltransferase